MVNADDEAPEPDPGPPEHLSAAKGMDLVRRVLEEARGAARTQGKDVGRGNLPGSPRPLGGAYAAASGET